MKVKNFMVPLETIIKCRPESTVAEVATLMVQNKVGSVLVVDEAAQRAIGIVTKNDLVRAIADGCDTKQTAVTKFASTNLIFCAADDERDDVQNKMLQAHVHHLLVADAAGRLVGMTSSYDVMLEAALDAKAWPFTRTAVQEARKQKF